MALEAGDQAASFGMAKEIYDKLNEMLISTVPVEGLTESQRVWRELAFAIATGVIAHLLNNLEITGLRVSGQARLPVTADTASGSVTLAQSGNTTGLIR